VYYAVGFAILSFVFFEMSDRAGQVNGVKLPINPFWIGKYLKKGRKYQRLVIINFCSPTSYTFAS